VKIKVMYKEEISPKRILEWKPIGTAIRGRPKKKMN
jgi:hypothetical protein